MEKTLNELEEIKNDLVILFRIEQAICEKMIKEPNKLEEGAKNRIKIMTEYEKYLKRLQEVPKEDIKRLKTDQKRLYYIMVVDLKNFIEKLKNY